MAKQAVGNLSIVLSADAQGALTGIKLVGDAAARLGGASGKSGSKFGQSFVGGIAHNLAGRGVGMLSNIGGSVHQSIIKGMEENAKRESMGLSFELLLGDKKKAAAAMKSADDVGRAGGLDPMAYMQGTKSLMGSSGMGIEKSTKLMKQLSIISIATGADVGRLGVAVGQIYAKGTLRAEEVFGQLGDNGFPVIELVKTWGTSMVQFRKDMEDGKVTADVLEKTLTRLANVNFAGAMGKNAETMAGKTAIMEASTKRMDASLAKHGFNTTEIRTQMAEGVTHISDNWEGFKKGWLSDAPQARVSSGAISKISGNGLIARLERGIAGSFDQSEALDRAQAKARDASATKNNQDALYNNPFNKNSGKHAMRANQFKDQYGNVKNEMTGAQLVDQNEGIGLGFILGKINTFAGKVSKAKHDISHGLTEYMRHMESGLTKWQDKARDEHLEYMQGPKNDSHKELYEYNEKSLDKANAANGLDQTKAGKLAFDRQRVANFASLEQSVDLGKLFETKLPAAMAKGSQAAESVINNASNQRGQTDREGQIRAVLDEGNKQRQKLIDEQKETQKILEKIAGEKKVSINS